jgi:hypothetical protein
MTLAAIVGAPLRRRLRNTVSATKKPPEGGWCGDRRGAANRAPSRVEAVVDQAPTYNCSWLS